MVGIYVRLSDEDRFKESKADESESIQNQKLLLKDYCVERNWEIYDIYCDEDYSGTDFSRPDFQRMLSDCKSGKINIVLCKSQSRFSRDMSVIETYIHGKFIEWGVRFVSVVDRADTQDLGNKKARQINGLINEWYCEDVSENIRKVLQNKRQNGQFTGSFAPYGYLVDPNDKNHLIIDDVTAPVVRDIFNWYIQGLGYRKIAMNLNEMDIPSPTAYKQQINSKYVNAYEHKSPSKGMWTVSTIYTMIRNETYTGMLVQGKSHNLSYKNKKRKKVAEKDWIRVSGCHDAIISKEVWDKAQEKLNSRLRVSKVTQELSPLAGKVKCAECGKPMKRNVYYNKKRTIKYYSLTCASYTTGAMNCSNTSSMSGKKLEEIILEQLNLFIKQYCQFDQIDIIAKGNDKANVLHNSMEQYKNKIKSLEDRCLHLYEDKLDGIITKEQYISFNKKYNDEINDLTKKCDSIKAQIIDLQSMVDGFQTKQELLKRYSNITELTRVIADEFIESVEIGAKIDGKEREIKINWNF